MPKEYGTPGPRALHPDVATSKSLGRCGILSQLLFDRLISQADDQGRLEDGAEYVKAICLPLVAKATPRVVEDSLDELAREGMLLRYRAGGRDLIQLTSWWAYQGSMRWSYPSRWPAPDGWEDRISRPTPKGQGGTVPHDAEDRGNTPNHSDLARAGASRASQPDPTGPDRSETPRTRPKVDGVWDVALLIEELTGRTPSPKVTEDLRADVAQLGAERVMAAIRDVHGSGDGPFDAAGLVYGAHNALFPLPGARRESPRERRDRDIADAAARIRAEAQAAKAAQA